MNKTFGARSSDVLERMQKVVLSSSLNIVRTFKLLPSNAPDPDVIVEYSSSTLVLIFHFLYINFRPVLILVQS